MKHVVQGIVGMVLLGGVPLLKTFKNAKNSVKMPGCQPSRIKGMEKRWFAVKQS